MALTPTIYYELREELLSKSNEAVDALKAASERVYRGSVHGDIIAQVWQLFGDKPLFSAMQANKLGARYAYMWKEGFFPATAQEMADPNWEISYTRHSGNSWNANDNYELVGRAAKAFAEEAGRAMTIPGSAPGKRPKVGKQRLFNMRTIAQNLVSFATPVVGETTSRVGALKAQFEAAKEPSEFLALGRQASETLGVGLTTAFHGLCDMGFEVIKPDMHAARSVCYFGSVSSELGVSDPNKYLGRDANKAEVVSAGVLLARQIKPLPEFEGYSCREVDAVLLWASKSERIFDFPRAAQ